MEATSARPNPFATWGTAWNTARDDGGESPLGLAADLGALQRLAHGECLGGTARRRHRGAVRPFSSLTCPYPPAARAVVNAAAAPSSNRSSGELGRLLLRALNPPHHNFAGADRRPVFRGPCAAKAKQQSGFEYDPFSSDKTYLNEGRRMSNSEATKTKAACISCSKAKAELEELGPQSSPVLPSAGKPVHCFDTDPVNATSPNTKA